MIDNYLYIEFSLLSLIIGYFLGWFLRYYNSKTKLNTLEYKLLQTQKEFESFNDEKRDNAIKQSEILKEKLIAEGYELKNKIISEAEILKDRIISESEVLKSKILTDAEYSALQYIKQAKEEEKQRLSEISATENKLERREALIEEKTKSLDDKNLILSKKIEEKEELINSLSKEIKNITNLEPEEIKEKIYLEKKEEIDSSLQKYIAKSEKEMILKSENKAREILVSVMQRVNQQRVMDTSVSNFRLPSDDVKGKLIGRDGRNIKTFENFTGVNLIIGASNEVSISCFDPIRREIAKRALEFLLVDKKINQATIENSIEKSAEKIEDFIYEKGQEILFELGIEYPSKMVKAIGSLYFRSSYGQNTLYHSKEVALLAEMIAKEVGADSDIAKRGGLLHDVGKGIITDKGYSHIELGVELAKSAEEDKRVINCIAAHHGEVPYSCVESIIVQIADAVSSSRPGARNETLENFYKRLEALESLAMEYEGVLKAYAIQSGRELRVMVNAEEIGDNESKMIAIDLCSKIQDGVKFPGKIKIVIIRETKFIEWAG